MTQIGAVASAVATCVLILGLAFGSNALLDRYFPASSGATDVAVAAPGAPCVDASGKWFNWPWANAPTLAPRCPADQPTGSK